jgi:hypothetical protein
VIVAVAIVILTGVGATGGLLISQSVLGVDAGVLGTLVLLIIALLVLPKGRRKSP